MSSFKLSCVLITLLVNVIVLDGRLQRRSQKHLNVCRREFLKPLDVRQRSAALVFTGQVEKTYHRQRNHGHHYKALVRVKRVIKGLRQFQGNRVIVEGFGSNKICVSDVQVKDTRIFLANPSAHGRLKLNSSLIRVNRKNVRKAVNAAKQDRSERDLMLNSKSLRFFSNKLINFDINTNRI